MVIEAVTIGIRLFNSGEIDKDQVRYVEGFSTERRKANTEAGRFGISGKRDASTSIHYFIFYNLRLVGITCTINKGILLIILFSVLV